MPHVTSGYASAAQAPITAHPSFVSLIAGWFAAFGGLGCLILPAPIIGRISMVADLGVSGDFYRPVFALTAALIGGLIGFGIGLGIQKLTIKAHTSRAQRAPNQPRPIVASEELGSESLDAPINEADLERWEDIQDFDPSAPFDDQSLDEQLERIDGDDELLGHVGPEISDPAIDLAWFEVAEEEPVDAPDPLDLNAFAVVEDEHDDWADTRSELPSEESAAPSLAEQLDPIALACRLKDGNALEQLRATPKQNLSLVQMVERFAAALHEHQEHSESSGTGHRGAALAEGLKALAILSQDRPKVESRVRKVPINTSNRRDALRDALEKLRSVSHSA